ncbi:MAG: sulfotransferase family 2 domain-containing protein [Akkermansiaceae bacterium]
MIKAILNRAGQKILGRKYRISNILWRKKCIFIHVPKTAGTSVYKSLQLNKSHHYSLKDYESFINPFFYKRLMKFAIVRHPFSRFVSLYNYARLEESEHHSASNPDSAPYGKHLDYDILKSSNISQAVDLLIAGKLRHDLSFNHWQPQTTWTIDSKGQIPDLIGKLENLDDFVIEVRKKMGIHLNLEHANKSSASDKTTDTLSRDDKEKLYNFYKNDFIHFGYDFCD